MKNAKATQDFTLDGKEVAKGEILSLPANQFDDLESVGLIEKAPAPKAEPERS